MSTPEPTAPPTGLLQVFAQIAEAIHATSVCEVGDPVRCGGGCWDAADAVLPVIEQHGARPRKTDTDGPEWYGCRTIQHCATFGWCRRCAPEVAARAAMLLEAVRKTRLDESKVAEVYQVIAKAMRDTQQATLRARALHADTERRLKTDLAAEVRKREAAEATARTLAATVSGVHEYVQNLDQMAESTASADDRRLYRALAADLRKRLGYDTDAPEES